MRGFVKFLFWQSLFFFFLFSPSPFKLAESPWHGAPISASGPQVSDTLLSVNNVGKGIRQNGPVTLGKGLALVARVGHDGCILVFC